MIYDFALKPVGILIGLLLVVTYGFALLKGNTVKEWLTKFPRSQGVGIALTSVATLWAFWLILTMDLGEYSNLRRPILFAIPVAWFLTIKFVDDFLSVRALGILLLLAACIPLEAAFMKPQVTRLLVVVLAYVWALKGLFMVGMPYLTRDQIGWMTRNDSRWRYGMITGVVYGAVTLVCAVLFY